MTERVRVLQTYGRDGVMYKIQVKFPSGNQYLVWYYDSLGVNQGDVILITHDGYGRWEKINNPNNGNQSNIYQYNKIEG